MVCTPVNPFIIRAHRLARAGGPSSPVVGLMTRRPEESEAGAGEEISRALWASMTTENLGVRCRGRRSFGPPTPAELKLIVQVVSVGELETLRIPPPWLAVFPLIVQLVSVGEE